MPKFLDRPSWYISQGPSGSETSTEVVGIGYRRGGEMSSGQVLYGASDGIVAGTSAGTNGNILTVKNGVPQWSPTPPTVGSIFMAGPALEPQYLANASSSGKVLMSMMGTTPQWADTINTVNGRNVNTNYSNTSIYAPVSSGTNGQILVSSGNGVAPGWEDAPKSAITYFSTFSSSGYLSNSVTVWSSPFGIISIGSSSSSASATFCDISLSSNEGIVIFNFPAARGQVKHYIIGPDGNVTEYAGSGAFSITTGMYQVYGLSYSF